MALRVPGRLRPQIISTFGTTRVVGRQPYAPAAFTPEEIPGTHFQRLSQPQGTWFCRKEPRKKSPVTPPGIDPGTVRLVAQCLNHYATPGPLISILLEQNSSIFLQQYPVLFTIQCSTNKSTAWSNLSQCHPRTRGGGGGVATEVIV